MHKKIMSIVYIAYRIPCVFCNVMYYIISNICIGGCFAGGCFYFYSQKNISSVANESLVPYNLIKRAPGT